MSDYSQWDTSDANNNNPPPDGWPEDMNYNEVNNAGRAVMGATARFFADINGTLVTGGTGNAYTLTSFQSITAYAIGIFLGFRVDRANTGAATLNLNGIGGFPLRRESGVELVENDLAVGAYQAMCDGTQFLLVSSPSKETEVNIGDLDPLTVASALNILHTLDDGGLDTTITVQQIIDLIANLTTPETAIETADLMVFSDDSDANKIKTVARDTFFGLISELNTPETVFENNDLNAMIDVSDGNRIKTISNTDLYNGIDTDVPANSWMLFLDDSDNLVKRILRSEFVDNVIKTSLDATADIPGMEFSVGGIIVKVGNVQLTTSSAQTFVFTTAFPTTCWGVWVNRRSANSTNPVQATDINSVQFVINRSDFDSGTDDIDYIAIGV